MSLSPSQMTLEEKMHESTMYHTYQNQSVKMTCCGLMGGYASSDSVQLLINRLTCW